LWATFLSFPLPFIATLTGWFTAEVGRQPWSVYGILRTADAVTPTLTVEAVTISLIIFAVVYLRHFQLRDGLRVPSLEDGTCCTRTVLPNNPKTPTGRHRRQPIAEAVQKRGWL